MLSKQQLPSRNKLIMITNGIKKQSKNLPDHTSLLIFI